MEFRALVSKAIGKLGAVFLHTCRECTKVLNGLGNSL